MVELNINKDTDIALEIYEAAVRNRRESRRYLGMSEIGKPCTKAVWFSWRRFTPAPWDGRILILFEFGDLAEQLLTKSLRLAGYELQHAYPDRQLSFEDHGGFFAGHCDGLVRLRTLEKSPWAILECKSMNMKKFDDFKRHDLEVSNPTYYAQVQAYMGYCGLEHAMLIAFNKNDSAIHHKVIRFRPDVFQTIKDKAATVLNSHNSDGSIAVPLRGFDDPQCLECRYCGYRFHCWDDGDAIQTTASCRSCEYFQLLAPEFKPRCLHASHEVELTNVNLSCPDYQFIGSVPF